MKIMITGAAGALGQAVVSQICARSEYQLFPIVRAPVPGMTGNVIACDLLDARKVMDALESVQPDVILHLAARFHGNLESAFLENVEPSRHILDSVERLGLKSRVLLTGSAAEYGVVHPDENPIAETHSLFPVSVYGVSKAWQTQLVGLYASRGVDVICARIFNLFGPGISDRLFAGRIQQQIEAVLAGRRAYIEVGPLTAVRDYVSLDDGARQLIAISEFGNAGEIYHIGSGAPIAMREFLGRQLELHGLDPCIVRVSQEFSNRHGYDVPAIYANMKKTNDLMTQRLSNGKA